MTAFAAIWREPPQGAFGARAMAPAVWRDASPGLDLIRPGLLFSPLTLTRAQASGARSTALNADGVTWSEFAADVPRFNGAARRLLIGGQRTNSIRNPRAEGAVAGSTGTMPTNWGSQATQNGLTRSLAFATVSGVAGLVVTYAGVPDATNSVQFVFEGSASIAALSGQTWTQSVLVSLFSGSAANVTFAHALLANTAAGAGVENLSNGVFDIDGTLRRFSGAGTITAGTAAFVQPRLRISYTIGLAVNISVFIALPQLGLGAFASSPILPPVGTPAASTRGTDLVTATLASLGIAANGACTIIGTAMLPQAAPAGLPQWLAQIDDGTDLSRYFIRNNGGSTLITAGRVGLDATPSSLMTAGTLFRWGISIDGAGRIASCVDGGTVQAATGGPTTGMTTLRFGATANGTSNMFGEIGTVRVLPYAVTDAELQRLVAGMPT